MFLPYAVVTPLRKAASYEPCIAILGIWGDTWLTSWQKYGIYMAVRGSYGALTGSTWRLSGNSAMKNQHFLLSCLLRDGNEDTLISAA